MQRKGLERGLQLIDGFWFRDGRTSLAEVEDFLLSAIVLGFVWLIDKHVGFHRLILLEVQTVNAMLQPTHQEPVGPFSLLGPFVAKLQCLLPVLAGNRILYRAYSPLTHAQVRHIRGSVALVLEE